MTTGVFYHKAFLDHDAGYGHPERAERLVATLELLEARHVFDGNHVRLLEPRAATIPELERVHPRAYIDLIHAASDRESSLDADTSASKGSYNAALLAAGAGLKAWDAILHGELTNAFALVRPPGHHANATSARGFCLFNNIAVLARHITSTMPDSRVFILDVDAHHGNGTQEIFYEDPKILYLSFHEDGRSLYPGYSGFTDEVGGGPGKGYTVNVPLPPGTSDLSHLYCVRTLFPTLAEQFRPTAILVSVGYDGHYRDSLTHLALSNVAYFEISKLVAKTAEKLCKGRVVMFLEGGYDLKAISESIYNTLVGLSGHGTPIDDKPPAEDPRVADYVRKLLAETRRVLEPWWRISQT
jgi:acetoin utilization deacetylase AcuC-like enzyme